MTDLADPMGAKQPEAPPPTPDDPAVSRGLRHRRFYNEAISLLVRALASGAVGDRVRDRRQTMRLLSDADKVIRRWYRSVESGR